MKPRTVPCGNISTKIIPGSAKESLLVGGTTTHDRASSPAVAPSSHRQCVALSTQGLLAFAMAPLGRDILVVDAGTMQLVQTLSAHAVPIRSLLWLPPLTSYAQHGVKLLSGDTAGNLLLWDVSEGAVLLTTQITMTSPIVSLSLLATEDHRQSSGTAGSVVAVTEAGSTFLLHASNLKVIAVQHASVNGSILPGGNASPSRNDVSSSSSAAATSSSSSRTNRLMTRLSDSLSTNPAANGGSSSFPLSRFGINRCLPHVAAASIGDRIRVYQGVDKFQSPPAPASSNTAADSSSSSTLQVKDVVFESPDGSETIVDICFSGAIPELLYFATPSSVACYDWGLDLMLQEQMLWLPQQSGAFFVSIFPVTASSADEESRADALPYLYSYTSDNRLTAWYVEDVDKFHKIPTDVRGARLQSRVVSTVVQSDRHSGEFCVLFKDGGVARWTYDVAERFWSLDGFFECPMQRPTVCCTLTMKDFEVPQQKPPSGISRFRSGDSIHSVNSHPHDEELAADAHKRGSSSCMSTPQAGSSPLPGASPHNGPLDPVLDGGDDDELSNSLRRRSEVVEPPLNQDAHFLCAALDSGDIILHNVTFNRPERRYSVVHATGTTKIVGLAPHLSGGLFWLATCRLVVSASGSQRQYHQISLLHAATGVLERILRNPSTISDTSSLRSLTPDRTGTFLLLTFHNGAFEVWNTETGILIFVHNGSGVTGPASWGFRADAYHSNFQEPHQLIIASMEDGASLFYRVSRDQVRKVADPPSLRPSSTQGGSPYLCVVGSHCVVMDSGGGAVARSVEADAPIKWLPLNGFPKNAVVVQAVGQQHLTLLPIADETERQSQQQHQQKQQQGSPALRRAGSANEGSEFGGLHSQEERYLAVVFADGGFGVWDVITLKTVGYIRKGAAYGQGKSIAWVKHDTVVVMLTSGSFAVLHVSCDGVNSSVVSKCLRHPMQSPAFLLPTHSACVQTALEVQAFITADRLHRLVNAISEKRRGSLQSGSPSPRSRSDSAAQQPPNHVSFDSASSSSQAHRAPPPAAAEELRWSVLSQHTKHILDAPPSFLIQHLQRPLPTRGSLGQLITEDIRTLPSELKLYETTMVPPSIRSLLLRSANHHETSEKERIPAYAELLHVAHSIAVYFGQTEKIRFWSLVHSRFMEWDATADEALQFSKTFENSFTSHLNSPDSVELSMGSYARRGIAPWDVEGPAATLAGPPKSNAEERLLPVFPMLLPSRYHELLDKTNQLRANRSALCQLRLGAIQRLRLRGDVDDSVARLALSRELLILGEGARASDVLIDANHERDSFAMLATTAIAVAAAVKDQMSTLAKVTAKRAAAMLLAKGDVDAAVEKFSLIHEFYDAGLALLSRSRWGDAARMAKLAVMSESCRSELLNRWVANCIQKGDVVTAACMQLSLKSPRQAIATLASASHLTDMAGIFAVVLGQLHSSVLSRLSFDSEVPWTAGSPLSTEDHYQTDHSSAEPDTPNSRSLGDVLTLLLEDYANFLKSVGNVDGEKAILSLREALES